MQLLASFIINNLEKDKNYDLVLEEVFNDNNFENYFWYSLEQDNIIKGEFEIILDRIKLDKNNISNYLENIINNLNTNNKLNIEIIDYYFDNMPLKPNNKISLNNKIIEKKDNFNIDKNHKKNNNTKIHKTLDKKMLINNNISYKHIDNEIKNIKAKEKIVSEFKQEYINQLYLKYKNYKLEKLNKELNTNINYLQEIYIKFLILEKQYQSLDKSVLDNREFYLKFNNLKDLKEHLKENNLTHQQILEMLNEIQLQLENYQGSYYNNDVVLKKINLLLEKDQLEYSDLKKIYKNIVDTFSTDLIEQTRFILESKDDELFGKHLNELNEIKYLNKLENYINEFKLKNSFIPQNLENLDNEIIKNKSAKEYNIYFNNSLFKNDNLKIYSTAKQKRNKYYVYEIKDYQKINNFVQELINDFPSLLNNISKKDLKFNDIQTLYEDLNFEIKNLIENKYYLKDKKQFNLEYIHKKINKSIKNDYYFSSPVKNLSQEEEENFIFKISNFILENSEIQIRNNINYNRKENITLAYNYVKNEEQVLKIFKNASLTNFTFWKPIYESNHIIDDAKALEYKCKNKKITFIPSKLKQQYSYTIYSHKLTFKLNQQSYDELFKAYNLNNSVIDKENNKIYILPNFIKDKINIKQVFSKINKTDFENSHLIAYKNNYFEQHHLNLYKKFESLINKDLELIITNNNENLNYQEIEENLKELIKKQNLQLSNYELNDFVENLIDNTEIMNNAYKNKEVTKTEKKENLIQTAPKSEQGKIYFQGFNTYEIAALSKYLSLADNPTEVLPDLEINKYLNKYSNFEKKLNYAQDKIPVHGLTNVEKTNKQIQIFKNIIDANGLHSIASRRTKAITHAGLSVLGDIASGIDRGIAFNYYQYNVHGNTIYFLAKPTIFERDEICLAPKDFGGGHNRYPEFLNYLHKIENNNKKNDIFIPSFEARQKHLNKYIGLEDNEIYVTDSLNLDEIDSIFINNKALYDSLLPIIQEAQEKNIISQSLNFVVSNQDFPNVSEYLQYRAYHFNL